MLRTIDVVPAELRASSGACDGIARDLKSPADKITRQRASSRFVSTSRARTSAVARLGAVGTGAGFDRRGGTEGRFSGWAGGMGCP
ncbi:MULTISPECIES: hypothetical protein [unclassified Streptomyces]|uniref:hypothetical protein n=1 Tax=unclassified Streptomyces TaxID=2593676 RepID=UPI00093C3A7A|nr:hypothetical protein [Streptomyces sp. CB02400]OKK05225.1 hypothetical protein AMK33_23830 [Streptomyces sp. CB02400]